MIIIPVLSLGLGMVLYFGSRTIVRDMRRRETAAGAGVQVAAV